MELGRIDHDGQPTGAAHETLDLGPQAWARKRGPATRIHAEHVTPSRKGGRGVHGGVWRACVRIDSLGDVRLGDEHVEEPAGCKSCRVSGESLRA